MRLKFPDLTQIHCQFENPQMIKDRAKEISQIATNLIHKLEEPRLLRRLTNRVLEIWRA